MWICKNMLQRAPRPSVGLNHRCFLGLQHTLTVRLSLVFSHLFFFTFVFYIVFSKFGFILFYLYENLRREWWYWFAGTREFQIWPDMFLQSARVKAQLSSGTIPHVRERGSKIWFFGYYWLIPFSFLINNASQSSHCVKIRTNWELSYTMESTLGTLLFRACLLLTVIFIHSMQGRRRRLACLRRRRPQLIFASLKGAMHNTINIRQSS